VKTDMKNECIINHVKVLKSHCEDLTALLKNKPVF